MTRLRALVCVPLTLLVLLGVFARPSLAQADRAPAELAGRAAVRAAAVSDVAPVLDPPSAMTVRAGLTADQVLHATDADGDPLTFSKAGGPWYMTVTTLDPGAGSASGNVHLAPTHADVGVTTGTVGASDGSLVDRKSFNILVFPVLNQPAGMTLDEGTIADQTLTAMNPENDPLSFSMVSGPLFMTVTTGGDNTGNVHLAPGFADHGTYFAVVSVADGPDTDRKSFGITVRDANGAPVLAQPKDMHAVPWVESRQLLTATDPDGQALTFSKVSGPWYMAVGTYPSVPRGRISLLGGWTDLGVVVATVGVSDGVIRDQKSFTITLDEADVSPVLSQLHDIDLFEGMDEDQSFSAFDPDGQRLYPSVSGLPRFMSLTSQPQPDDYDSLLGRIRLMPTYEDAGTYSPTLTISDGWSSATKTLNVTVRDRYSGETSLRLGTGPGGQFPPGLEYEYSAADGSYSPYAYVNPAGAVRITFAGRNGSAPEFRSDTLSSEVPAGWTLVFAAPVGLPLVEGVYENANILKASLPGKPTFWLAGLDPHVPDLTACSNGTVRFEIKRIVRRIDGSVLSFWATFQVTCVDGSHISHGEIRYNAQSIPITLVAPRWMATHTHEALVFSVSAADTAADAIALTVSGLPPGAKFVEWGGYNVGGFAWTPTLAQQGEYSMRFVASSAGGLADTAHTTIRVTYLNHAPVAVANGDYEGTIGVPIPFTAAGTVDQDGDALSYHWAFGDRTQGDGARVDHAYGAVGIYLVTLLVSDGTLAGSNAAIARVYATGAARVFAPGAGGPLRLVAGSGRFCVGFEPGPVLGSREDVYLSSLRMHVAGLGSVDTIVADSASVAVGDSDQNGVSDVTACFHRDDLRKLFAFVTGRVRTSAAFEIALRDGHGARGYLPLDVIGPDPTLSVLVTPNPLNPVGAFSFVTTRSGTARLRLFDSRGSLVRTLLDAPSMGPGYHDVWIDGRGENGRQLSSGIYYYRLETTQGNRTGRIAIVK